MSRQHNLGTTRGGDDVRFPSASVHVASPGEKAAHLERVDAYEQDGVLRADPDAAFLAVILAELFRIACGLEDAAQEALGHSLSSTGGLRAERTIVQYLRVVRRIERYARLETLNRRVIPRDRMA